MLIFFSSNSQCKPEEQSWVADLVINWSVNNDRLGGGVLHQQSHFPYLAPTVKNMKNLPMQARFPAPTAGFSNIFTRLNKGFWRL